MNFSPFQKACFFGQKDLVDSLYEKDPLVLNEVDGVSDFYFILFYLFIFFRFLSNLITKNLQTISSPLYLFIHFFFYFLFLFFFFLFFFFIQEGNTGLHLACQKGHRDIVEFLLPLVSDISLKNNVFFLLFYY